MVFPLVSKTVTFNVPPWVSDEELARVIDEVLSRLGGAVPIDELRRALGIKPEDLVEEVEAYRVESLEEREKERLR